MPQQLQKTQEQQSEFIKKFAGIVSENSDLKEKYKISFVQKQFVTKVIILNNDGALMDVEKLMSKPELVEYSDLVIGWKVS